MRESQIVDGIEKYLKGLGSRVWFRKNHGGRFGRAGIPDIEVVFRERFTPPHGPDVFAPKATVAFLECKIPGASTTKGQDLEIAALKRAGAHVVVVNSAAEAIKWLESIGI